MSKINSAKKIQSAQVSIDIKIDDSDRIIYKGVPLEMRVQNILNSVYNEEKGIREILDDAYDDKIDEIRDEKLSKILLNRT